MQNFSHSDSMSGIKHFLNVKMYAKQNLTSMVQ